MTLTADHIAEMIRDYKAGLTTTEIAEKYGHGRSTVERHFRLRGVQMHKGHRHPPNKRVAAWIYAYQQGESTLSIAQSAGVGSSTVRRWLIKYGVERRDVGKRRKSLRARIIERCEVRGDCLHWPGGGCRGRYGRIQDAGKQHVVHRVMWEHKNGALGSRTLDNVCGDRMCCNPDHWVLGKEDHDPWARLVDSLSVDPDFHCWVTALGGKERARMTGHRDSGSAQRRAWSEWRGRLPAEREVWRRCGNKHCLNPDHLFLQPKNSNRFEPPQWALESTLVCPRGHWMLGDSVWMSADEWGEPVRHCRECRQEKDRELMERIEEEPEPMNPRERFRQMQAEKRLAELLGVA